MWELINANKRNSVILMFTMALCLFVLGLFLGFAIAGPRGGVFGLTIAVVIWLVLTLVSFSSGDQILLASSKAVPVTKKVHPQLFNVVEEMAIAASIPMPKIYIINDPAPNAFATGRKPETASVAITAGLLAKLNRDELQGVIAHEISHILHRDILFVTMAGIMLGSIVILSQVFLRSMIYGGAGSRRRYSSGSSNSGQGYIVLIIIAIIAAILAPLMAQLLYFALSRKREYLADAGAVRLTRYPEGLAGALEKIANDTSPQLAAANKVTAPMYFANPMKKHNAKKLSDLTSTHPPISERIKILHKMTHGASMKDYSRAFKDITHNAAPIPAAGLADKDIEVRSAQAEETPKKSPKTLGDIMRKVNGFAFLTCNCGLKLKIPPNFKSNTVKCPRCHTELKIN